MNLFNRNPPEDAPETNGLRWQRHPNDLATRIELGDIGGFLNSEVIVEPGTNAVIIADGETQGVMPPGRYSLQTIWDKIKALLSFRTPKQVSAIIIDTNDLDLQFGIADPNTARLDPNRILAYTNDPIRLNFVLQVRLCINRNSDVKPNAMDFFMNVMKGRQRYTVQDLIAHLQPEVENAVQEFVKRHSANEINGNLLKKAELEQMVELHLESTLSREGFTFHGVRAMRISHDRFDKLTQQREELLLLEGEHEAELEKRIRLFDVLKGHDVQDIAQETQKVAMHEKRAVLLARMRRSVLNDKTDELFSEQDLKDTLHEIDRQSLLREDDRAELLLDLEKSRRSRAHFLAKLDLGHRYEIKLIELQHVAGFEQAQAALLRQRLETEQGLALQRARGELQLRHVQEDADRARANALAADLRKRMLEDAQAEVERKQLTLNADLMTARTALDKARIQHEIDKLERESDRLDGEMGIALLAQMKAVRRQDDFEREERRLKSRQAELDMEIARKRAEHDMHLETLVQTQAHEIRRMETMGMLPPEALIALSSVEQGRIISELKQTDAYKLMSEEQIMALMAAKSPALAQALTAKWQAEANKGAMSPEVKALYEKMVADKDRTNLAQSDQFERLMRMQQDAMLQMGDKIKDAASNVSANVGRSQPGQTVVVTGGSGNAGATIVPPGAGGSSGAPQVAVCPKCHTNSPLGVKFCSNCGYQFYH
ncbi:MAG: hypothetical protein KIH69_010365 [Anaerolineae bacterium]|nr:hypothetical protein [Anaerolineae bacterium]